MRGIFKLAKFLLPIWLAIAFLLYFSPLEAVRATPLQILLPLYSYPNWYHETYQWQAVVNAAQKVPITVIINPNNGPNNAPPNSDYARGLADLRAGGVTILGYVYTLYGDRPLAEVKADIDLYDRYYPVRGIFLDEAASNAAQLDYYLELYHYIKAKPNLKLVVTNQGTNVDEAYLSKPATDIAVIFENYSQPWQKYQMPAYQQSYRANQFAALIHSVADAATMKQHLDKAVERNLGYIYITDDSPDNGDRDPWNSVPSYWQEEIEYLLDISY